MEVGDLAFFYHSNTKPPGIVGLMQIAESQVIDPTQFDPESDYYDPKATPLSPRWYTVKVEFVRTFTTKIDLETLRSRFTPAELLVVKQGNRLSVMPIDPQVAAEILLLAEDPKPKA
jgi:predicted RNA-binding protein with PUA-like domain